MQVNYLAILLCGVAAMIIGGIWYGPLFGKMWGEIIGSGAMAPEQKEAMKKSMWMLYLTQFILALITAWALSYVITNWTDFSTPFTWIAFWLWFGFVMTTHAGATLWSGKPKKVAWRMFLISTGGQLVTFIVFALIIGML